MTENQPEIAEKYTYDDKLTELCRGLTHNQLRYLSVFQDYPTKKDAAEALGLEPNTLYHWPPEVDEAAELMRQDSVIVAREILRRASTKAAMIKASGLDSPEEKIRQDSATEILDRNMGKAKQTQELTGADGADLRVILKWPEDEND